MKKKIIEVLKAAAIISISIIIAFSLLYLVHNPNDPHCYGGANFARCEAEKNNKE